MHCSLKTSYRQKYISHYIFNKTSKYPRCEFTEWIHIKSIKYFLRICEADLQKRIRLKSIVLVANLFTNSQVWSHQSQLPKVTENDDGTLYQDVLEIKRFQVKQRRAQGGCLGTESRWKTWQAAISCGEEQISRDPQISEWGNLAGQTPVDLIWIK